MDQDSNKLKADQRNHLGKQTRETNQFGLHRYLSATRAWVSWCPESLRAEGQTQRCSKSPLCRLTTATAAPRGAEARKTAVLTCRFKSRDERSLASFSRDYCQPIYNNDHGCGPRVTLIQHKHRLLQKRQHLSLPLIHIASLCQQLPANTPQTNPFPLPY